MIESAEGNLIGASLDVVVVGKIDGLEPDRVDLTNIIAEPSLYKDANDGSILEE